MKRAYWTVGIIAMISLVVFGGYLLYRQFQRDRREALGFVPRPEEPRSFAERRPSLDGRTVNTYTKEDLDNARRNGAAPTSVQNPNPAIENQEAIQRNLRAIEEINRINEINRRLQEQQQRQQR